MFFRSAISGALDPRGMIVRVRKYNASGNQASQRAEGRLVGDVAGRKEECRILAVKVRYLALQQHVIMTGARNVARAAGAGADAIDCFMHRSEYRGMLPHSKIVI